MLQKILEAVYQKRSAALKSALPGGLYLQSAPQDVSSPYAVMYYIGGGRQEVMGGPDDGIEETEIQFNVFSTTRDGGIEVTAAAEAICNCYDWCKPAIDGYYALKMQRDSISNLGWVDGAWQITITYSIWYAKEG